ncbi:unnamed protein product (macronuclear) [Paramecium tetraurelia]|uniref:Uncharacterized protein n=1 Tax=Paramecium tetraurelia TaxID=5888 RepID=A0CQL0_PARTE|nr:uncharacterized protein GSPATT00009425001 [Paramecium tetraurelia]CAK73077.1 unnamed protein product [Paramecium tetraurelia]|eukprot:XP_001440474.1 hypothetical protein (macronuclear) [Paramecium tetraurelia strain d4-2]
MSDMVQTFSIHSNKHRSTQKQQKGLLMKGVTIRNNMNLKLWLNEVMNRKEIDLKLGKLNIYSQRHDKQSKYHNDLILPSIFRDVEDSQMFPMICFQKRTCRQLMREIRFEENVTSLLPSDKRNSILYGLLKELIYEIEFREQNILICQHRITKVFYIYFTDCLICPISKCCYTSVVFVLGQIFGGQIRCNNENCPIQILVTFDIQEELLWKKNQVDLSNRFSKYIISGKFRTNSLKTSIQPTDVSKSNQQYNLNINSQISQTERVQSKVNLSQQSNYEKQRRQKQSQHKNGFHSDYQNICLK